MPPIQQGLSLPAPRSSTLHDITIQCAAPYILTGMTTFQHLNISTYTYVHTNIYIYIHAHVHICIHARKYVTRACSIFAFAHAPLVTQPYVRKPFDKSRVDVLHCAMSHTDLSRLFALDHRRLDFPFAAAYCFHCNFGAVFRSSTEH